MVQSPFYIHYVHRHPHHPSPSFVSAITDTTFLESLLERSRAQRDTYDERQKLVSTYKIISKTQCLLQMRSMDGYVDAKHVTNLDDTKETKDGVFVFLPIAVNLFLIQHKESKRYLCGKNNQLFGLTERNESQCVFETKRSDIDFGRWDSYRLFYEDPNRGYLSISHMCHTRLRRKFDNDNYLNFLAFVRINTDISLETAAARRIVDQQDESHRQKAKNVNSTNNKSPKLISDYRQRFRFSLSTTLTTTTTTTTSTTISTTTTTPTTTTTTISMFRPIRRLTFSPTPEPFKSVIVHVYSPANNLNVPVTTRRWGLRRTRRS
ncbi:unnamed protein product [Rotaria socialis]|uniref:Uncharacterized protein n=1 Tax=Rotaria socialis TaxID=392032 RepID=A0A817XWH9_9BILA|nr:unnamed protein product [Rotaria socialis]CAF3392327.1 unnamed protein product [Rotaria socialis]CAF3459024.1 unnamed protein product [Rotaria socialis]CAF4175987.1 unnamed protein product [Rotaria socialis]CAF4194735.1 unnamed protein product [Rotaria socialis]